MPLPAPSHITLFLISAPTGKVNSNVPRLAHPETARMWVGDGVCYLVDDCKPLLRRAICVVSMLFYKSSSWRPTPKGFPDLFPLFLALATLYCIVLPFCDTI